MRCECGGELQRKVVKIHFSENYDTIIIKIEADVCKKCGKRFFSDEAKNKIIEIKEKMDSYLKGCLPVIQEIGDKAYLLRVGEIYETMQVLS